jgi:hypothetical protein
MDDLLPDSVDAFAAYTKYGFAIGEIVINAF